MKDNFSTQSADYSKFRPTYPDALYTWLLSLVPGTEKAWDCGTGNGQVAEKLACFFDAVAATDISRQQMDQAIPNEKIVYSVQSAERTSFPDHSFDLITVAQAIHWFDFAAFYTEVDRTMKKNGILAVIGYGLMQIEPGLDGIISHLYKEVVGPFWDAERKYIDENYQTIPFPYKEIAAPAFEMRIEWSFEHLIGYLGTWSAVKHYKRSHQVDPVGLVYEGLRKYWGDAEMKVVRFPLLLRVGRGHY